MENTYSLINYTPHDDAELLDSYSRTITGVVGQVAEAVVHIQVNKPAPERKGRDGREGRDNRDSRAPQEPRLAPASGSGFVISTDGFIVTTITSLKAPRIFVFRWPMAGRSMQS